MSDKCQTPRKDAFWDLVAIAKRLQAPGGCPWDRAQTVQSLLPHLVEEAWEVFCAQRRRRRAELQEELGDVLYTTLFLTLIAERQGWFTLRALLQRTRRKMVRRHPHVFGTTPRARTAEEAYRHWQVAKRRERAERPPSRTLRPLLVKMWDALLEDAQAARRFQRALIARRPRRPNATRARGSSRSPSRGRRQRTAG